MSLNRSSLIVKDLKLQEYQTVWQQMQDFVANYRDEQSDELWLTEHPCVYTLGQAGLPEHILANTDIPIVKSDRGGQVTYHGPGQIVAYTLFNLRRKGLNIRTLVSLLEKSIMQLLAQYQIQATCNPDAPGVYVDHAKICSIGLRIRRGISYHGLALNVDMDLKPFQNINPCGFPELKVVQLRDFVAELNMAQVKQDLVAHIKENFNYTN